MDITVILSQINDVLTQWKTFSGSYRGPWSNGPNYTTDEELSHIFTTIFSTIERFSPINSPYHHQAKIIQNSFPPPDLDKFFYSVQSLAGILRSLREAYQNGYFQSIQELVHAELFDDFLEMAEHLLENNYKDAAAIMVGSVLESHIKKMCIKSGLPITTSVKGKNVITKADVLNADLVKNGTYNKLQQKQITAWFGLRNEAAHGNYQAYKKEEVDLMLKGVRQFILQNPA